RLARVGRRADPRAGRERVAHAAAPGSPHAAPAPRFAGRVAGMMAYEAAAAVEAQQLGVAVIGCGRIGARRARVTRDHPRTRLTAVADVDATCAHEVAGGAADVFGEWRAILDRDDVDI